MRLRTAGEGRTGERNECSVRIHAIPSYRGTEYSVALIGDISEKAWAPGAGHLHVGDVSAGDHARTIGHDAGLRRVRRRNEDADAVRGAALDRRGEGEARCASSHREIVAAVVLQHEPVSSQPR